MAKRRPLGAALITRTEYRFGIVLLLLLVTFVVLMVGSSARWVRPATVALSGTTLVAALFASNTSQRLRKLAAIAAVVVTAVAIVAAVLGETVGDSAAAMINAVLVAIAPYFIARSVVRRRVIDLRTVMAALCVYVLLGMLWAFVYTATGSVRSEPFFAQITDATTADYLYFSFITQTTVGYGDLSAAGNFGRACAVLEALIGQLYLVTVVALVVSRMQPRNRGNPVEE